MTRFPAGTFAPDPRPARPAAMVRAAATAELRIQVRNSEQLLLALVIPIAALVGLRTTSFITLPEPRITSALAGVLALAVMSTAFTAQAISTAFDRRYGVLKRLAAAGMSRWLLLAGKCGSACAVVLGQFVVLGAVAVAFGWRPAGSVFWLVPLTLLGVAAFLGLGLLLGGTLRAEAVLGLANLLWLAFVAVGGVLVPLADRPGWLRAVGELTPAGALSEGMRDVIVTGHAPGAQALAVLAGWILLGWAGALRWFKWQ